MIKYYFVIKFFLVTFLIITYNLISKDAKDTLADSGFEEFLNFLYQSKNVEINNNYLSLAYGPSKLFSFRNLKEGLSDAYNLKIDYGFLRISQTEDENILYLASEGAYLGNVSSHLKPKSWKNSGILFDAWAFGFNYKNGYGYKFNDFQIFLIHHGSLDWKKIDFETFTSSEIINRNLEGYNNDFRFGVSYESEIRVILSNYLLLHFNYSESHLYRRHLFGLWTLGSLGELFLQRGIDLISKEMIQSIPNLQPVLNLAIKTFISALVYSQRQSKAYFPFTSEPPLRFENIRFSIGLSF